MAKDMREYRGYGRKRYSSRMTFIICLVITLLAFAGVAIAVLLGGGDESARKGGAVLPGLDPAAVAGTLSGAAAGDLLPPGEFNLRMNQSILVTKGEANLRIENPVENRNAMKVVLSLQDGTPLYTTDIIRPYYFIENDKLDKALQPGTYSAWADFTVLDEKGDTVGTTRQDVSITVQ